MTVAEIRPHMENPLTELLKVYRDHLVDIDQLQKLPDPEWLIENYLMLDSLGCIWGDPGGGKSFITLDWALSVATGTPWFGNRVTQGNVLYIVGEGARGYKPRVNAWCKKHMDRPVGDQFLMLKKPIRILDEYHAELTVQLANEQGGVKLIVIDTLARALLGHNENDNVDMGRMIDISDQIKAETGACVLYVHHATKGSTKTIRGASALPGGIDTEIELEHLEGNLNRTLRCNKQKDAAEFKPIDIWLANEENSLVPTNDVGDYRYSAGDLIQAANNIYGEVL